MNYNKKKSSKTTKKEGRNDLPFLVSSALIFCQTISRSRRCTKVLRGDERKYGGKSERSLAHAGDLALISQLAEADTADAIVAQIGMRTTADLAAVVLTGGELSRSLLLQDHGFLSHLSVLLSWRRERP